MNQAIVAFRPSADKDVAEFVGITAIVASLIFVGLQMRQMGAIARSEMYGNDLANSLAVNSAIAAHSRVETILLIFDETGATARNNRN